MGKIAARGAMLLLTMTAVCGLLYTLLVTGLGQLLFPSQANGSLIEVDGTVYGSRLLGQPFSHPGHLWGRADVGEGATFAQEDGTPLYYAWPSNLSPAGDAFETLVAGRVSALRGSNPDSAHLPIPADLVTQSGSGLDPEISVAAAQWQIPRIAQARGLAPSAVEAIIQRYTTGPFLGVFGTERVNVLMVNLALEGILPS